MYHYHSSSSPPSSPLIELLHRAMHFLCHHLRFPSLLSAPMQGTSTNRSYRSPEDTGLTDPFSSFSSFFSFAFYLLVNMSLPTFPPVSRTGKTKSISFFTIFLAVIGAS